MIELVAGREALDRAGREGIVALTEAATRSTYYANWMNAEQRDSIGVAAALMEAGMAWLGTDRPMWLNLVRHNERARRFYRRFGFETDPATALDRAIPTDVMRRAPSR